MIDLRNWTKTLLATLVLPTAMIAGCGDGDPTDDEQEGIFDEDPIDDENELSEEYRQACNDYCVELGTCSSEGNVDMESCMGECTGALEQCQEDELEEAVGILAGCTKADVCDEVIECTWDVGTECFFGL